MKKSHIFLICVVSLIVGAGFGFIGYKLYQSYHKDKKKESKKPHTPVEKHIITPVETDGNLLVFDQSAEHNEISSLLNILFRLDSFHQGIDKVLKTTNDYKKLVPYRTFLDFFYDEYVHKKKTLPTANISYHFYQDKDFQKMQHNKLNDCVYFLHLFINRLTQWDKQDEFFNLNITDQKIVNDTKGPLSKNRYNIFPSIIDQSGVQAQNGITVINDQIDKAINNNPTFIFVTADYTKSNTKFLDKNLVNQELIRSNGKKYKLRGIICTDTKTGFYYSIFVDDKGKYFKQADKSTLIQDLNNIDTGRTLIFELS